MAVTKSQQQQAAQTPSKDRTPAQKKIVAEARPVTVRNTAHATTRTERAGR